MLEAIGAGDPNYKGKDWGDVWAQSPENEKLSREIQDIITDRRGASNDHSKDDRQYAMPLTAQMYTVIHRSFVAMWRDPQYVIGVFMLHIITGLFNSFTFWSLGNSQIDMQSRLFSVFMTLTIAPPLIQQLQPRFLHFRDVYESREGSAKIYSWPAMVWGAILSEVPVRILSGTIYCEYSLCLSQVGGMNGVANEGRPCLCSRQWALRPIWPSFTDFRTIPKRLLTMLRVLLVLGRRLPSRYLYIRERLALCDALRDLLSWVRTSNC